MTRLQGAQKRVCEHFGVEATRHTGRPCLARTWAHSGHLDSTIDLAGYAAVLREVTR
jgi:hypothetical protein